MKYFLLACFSFLSFLIPVSAANRGFWLDGVDYQGRVKDVEIKWVEEKQNDNLINLIKWILNRVLGILGLIALLVLIRWWFQMLTAAGDEKKYGAWQTHLKSAGIALLYIGIAWFVVSILFYLLELATT